MKFNSQSNQYLKDEIERKIIKKKKSESTGLICQTNLTR
jgi:hypothetical protein